MTSSSTLRSNLPVQPDHFYPGSSSSAVHSSSGLWLSPSDDAAASRGIPVFKPTMAEFADFEAYMTSIESWGMKSGIVKVIPPKEWTDALPSTVPQLHNVKLKNPIVQHMVGQGGRFKQQNVEKRRHMSVREWVEVCRKEGHSAPGIDEVNGRRNTFVPRKDKTKAVAVEEKEDAEIDQPSSAKLTPPPSTDPASSLPTPPSIESSHALRVAREAEKLALDQAFLKTFDPHNAWLPPGTKASDYTPEYCRSLERLYWRNCSFGVPPWYGADMAGSLFTKETTQWNVASLPSFLTRLLPADSRISGVNTPYLYFGSWRATFAWHVEDMDLFSINYIHWGAPKFWYAIPQARANAFEDIMKGYFPGDTKCPQFLRHKSYLVSPTLLSGSACRPNTLVQHAGEFVITYPRGYHAGFNLGLNCAESTNFALDSWLELGRKAGVCNCVGDSVRIDVDQLLRDREADQSEQKKRKVDLIVHDPNDQSSGNTSHVKRMKTSHPLPDSPTLPNHEYRGEGKRPIKAPLPPDHTVPFSKITVKIPKPKAVKDTSKDVPPMPCCLCASSEPDEELYRVVHPPPVLTGIRPTRYENGLPVWEAHPRCASVIPETWVDEMDLGGGIQKVVFGVDCISKDRWGLKCVSCSHPAAKNHGAKIQCVKGKCSKAFHVSCAAAGVNGAAFNIIKEVTNEVLLVDDGAADQTGSEERKAVKTITKLEAECFCALHNPSKLASKKATKDDRVRRDILALVPMARIKVRSDSGVFEVSFVSADESSQTLEVLWNDGLQRKFKWSNVCWEAEAPPPRPKPSPAPQASGMKKPSATSSKPPRDSARNSQPITSSSSSPNPIAPPRDTQYTPSNLPVTYAVAHPEGAPSYGPAPQHSVHYPQPPPPNPYYPSAYYSYPWGWPPPPPNSTQVQPYGYYRQPPSQGPSPSASHPSVDTRLPAHGGARPSGPNP